MSEEENVMVRTKDLEKTYTLSDGKTVVGLEDLTFDIPRGSFVVICGPSGSGKTTLLNILSGIDRPTKGEVQVNGQDLTGKDEDFLADFRCLHTGFVFQAYNLVSTLTVAENIAFPMEWLRKTPQEIETRVSELLSSVGLADRENHFPSQLSGGEQQRVAFARALANDPELILADEPTGNLDSKNAERILKVLQELKEKGKTVIVSTHEKQVREFADIVITLKNGRVVTDSE
ncbi:MAG: ABC transporter ATP-binding protein [Candidatus Bathyarchaeota archaeon]|nr:ABC transporter ATP-binding protein [Candidatus Bathyarchaeota archaeon]